MMESKIKEVINQNTLDSIYLKGFIDTEDDGVAQFYPDLHYIYFEFDNHLIEFKKFESYNKPSRLSIKIVDSIEYDIDLEDVMPGRSEISELIFKNPLEVNKVAKIYYFNLEEKKDVVLCDALQIKLRNGQDIFLDPGFLGINIGGLDVKQIWEDNLFDNVPESVCIDYEILI